MVLCRTIWHIPDTLRSKNGCWTVALPPQRALPQLFWKVPRVEAEGTGCCPSPQLWLSESDKEWQAQAGKERVSPALQSPTGNHQDAISKADWVGVGLGRSL
jgi:hypothetical protein